MKFPDGLLVMLLSVNYSINCRIWKGSCVPKGLGGQANARLITIAMRLFRRTDAVYIGDLFPSRVAGSADLAINREDAYRIIVDEIPVPVNTPWDDLFEFKNDEKSQQQLRNLRLWISDIAKGAVQAMLRQLIKLRL